MPVSVNPSGAASTVGLTPGRQTRAAFDVDGHPLLLESQWGGLRMGGQVSPAVARQRSRQSQWHRGCNFWASGCYTLAPLQAQLSRVQEQPLPTGALFQPSSVPGVPAGLQLTVASHTDLSPLYKPGSGTGLGGVLGINPAGSDPVLRKNVPAGSTWASDLVTPPEYGYLVDYLRAERMLTEEIDLDCYSDQSQRADQGYALRFSVGGSGVLTSPDYIGFFAFGQYALVLGGDGIAHIFERDDTVISASDWSRRATFRWSSKNRVAGQGHLILIFPHLGPGGQKYISFVTDSLDAGTPADTGDGAVGSTFTRGGALTVGEFVFRWDRALFGASGTSVAAGNVTTAGKIHWFQRRDVRCSYQLSRLVFEEEGTLLDLPWAMDTAFTPRTIFTNVVKREPSGCTIAATVADANNGALTGIDIRSPYLSFGFAGDGSDTPLLWGYKINRQPVLDTTPDGTQFYVPVQSIDLALGESDPRLESATVEVEDPGDQYPRLRNRGELPLRIDTAYTPPSGAPTGLASGKVALFRGFALRPSRIKKGVAGALSGRGELGGTRQWPSQEWSRYQVDAVGMWHQLTQTTTRNVGFENFAFDATAGLDADGNQQPWKVTDAIKVLLKTGGFPDAMMDMPDLAIRLYPGAGTDVSDQILEPATNVAAQVIRLARAYLGRYLVFDPMRGDLGTDGMPIGQWTLVGAPAAGAPPLLNFVGTPPSGSGAKQINLAAYPAFTLPTLGRRRYHVEPPESNHVWALNVASLGGSSGIRVENHVYNHLSYQVPGSSVVPDPDSPHYIGTERLLILGDPALWGGAGDGGYQATQNLVDKVLLRLFAYACMARRVLVVTAPLQMVYDAGSGRYRAPRFYDPVSVDAVGGWYVRSVTPAYESDRIQTAEYVLEALVPYLPSCGGE